MKKKKETAYQQFKLRRELGRSKELTDDYIKDLAERMVFFAHESDGSVYVTQFIAQEGIPFYTFRDWLDKYPDLYLHYQESKEIIAAKTLQNALHRKFDATTSKWFVNCISKEFRKATKEIAQEEEQKDHTVIIKEIKADEPDTDT